MTNLQNTRTELEKFYTHVTFVTQENNCSKWLVNEEMTELYISNDYTTEEILPMLVGKMIKSSYKVGFTPNRKTTDKIGAFKLCVTMGLLAPTMKAFKSSTYEAMQEMLEKALKN